jgi:uncharacterized protein with ParB-like and HNH nuclease domain
MQASETRLQNVIEGTVQYVVPLFQRPYSWDKKEWQILWDDIVELCEMETPRAHFIGSIVSMPTVSVPQGVAKYLLIDGQQRLTTIFMLLTLLRDTARSEGQGDLADEIQELFLVNKFKKGQQDFFKLMPTQSDRDVFKAYIETKPMENDSKIALAYDFFKRKLKQKPIDIERLKKVIISSFSIVSIVLDPHDNPYLVFESLNAKGRPLTQADLIRNYFFMRVHADNQNDVYQLYWHPMQEALKDNLTEFIRHFLMRKGAIVKQSDVYYALKGGVTPDNALDYLKELNRFSVFYAKLLTPDKELHPAISKYLKRLNRIEVTTAYPLLMTCYAYYSDGKINADEFTEVLQTLENYLIRRFVCGVATNQLNKIFPSVFSQIEGKEHTQLVAAFKFSLQSKGYPKDNEFRNKFIENKMYGGGDRAIKTKLILETLEESYQHKEMVDIDKKFTIEHIMPQTLTDWWKAHLGGNWEDVHELYLHNIGNLTLTAYNSELSNDTFPSKCGQLASSHLDLNKYFAGMTEWNKDEIVARAERLSEIAATVWRYFGQDNPSSDAKDVTGTTPSHLQILGEKFNVASWRDVLEETLNTIAALEPEKFDLLAAKYPRYIGKEKSNFRTTRELRNRYLVEVNLSAKDVQKLCNQALDAVDLTEEDWRVTYS